MWGSRIKSSNAFAELLTLTCFCLGKVYLKLEALEEGRLIRGGLIRYMIADLVKIENIVNFWNIVQ